MMMLRSGRVYKKNTVLQNSSKSFKDMRSIIARRGGRILLKNNTLEWLFGETKYISSLTHEKEHAWGKSIIGTESNQWTTKFGEELLKEILVLLGKNPSRIKKQMKGKNGKKLNPDFETLDGLYENKARTYSTTGTAGEKILGTPVKYCECFRLYKKPLYIVCMGYQEFEADKHFHLFNPQSTELRKTLNNYKNDLKITYVRATDLVKEIINNN